MKTMIKTKDNDALSMYIEGYVDSMYYQKGMENHPSDYFNDTYNVAQELAINEPDIPVIQNHIETAVVEALQSRYNDNYSRVMDNITDNTEGELTSVIESERGGQLIDCLVNIINSWADYNVTLHNDITNDNFVAVVKDKNNDHKITIGVIYSGFTCKYWKHS